MTITDVLETRLQVVGLGAYLRDFQQLARALGVAKTGLNDAAKAELAISAAAGAASLAITAGLAKATLAAGEHQAILVRTSASFQQFGHSIPQSELEAWSNTVQDATGIARDQAVTIAGLYAEYGLTTEQVEKFSKATLEAAVALKAQGTSAEQIARFVGEALQMVREGNLRGLEMMGRRIGIIVNQARAATNPVNELFRAISQKGGQQAEERLKTLPGAIDAMSNAFVRLQQDVGKYFLPPITAAVQAITLLLNALDRVPGAVALVTTALAVWSGARAVGGVISLFRGMGGGGIGGLLAGLGGGGGGGIAGGGGLVRGAANMVMMGGAAGLINRFRGPGGRFVSPRSLIRGLPGRFGAAPPIIGRPDPITWAEFTGGAAPASILSPPGYGGNPFGGGAPPAAAGGGAGAFLRGLVAGRGLMIGAGIAGLAGFGLTLAGGDRTDPAGLFMRRAGGILGGAGLGAAAGSAIFPGAGTLIGALAGGIGGGLLANQGIEEQRAEKRRQELRVDSLINSLDGLNTSIVHLNENLGNFVGNRDAISALGGARLVAAFARGIA